MLAGFQKTLFEVATTDGRHFILQQPVDYVAADGTEYRIPIGATSDGASTPPILWEKFGLEWIPPFGSYWPAAVLHDAAYRNALMVWNGVSWITANLSKPQCDALLREAMESLGTHALTVDEIYHGVVVGGQSSFDQDRAQNAETLKS